MSDAAAEPSIGSSAVDGDVEGQLEDRLVTRMIDTLRALGTGYWFTAVFVSAVFQDRRLPTGAGGRPHEVRD